MINGRIFTLYLLFLLSISLPAFSQAPGTIGNWLMFFNQSRFHERWSTHSEVQYRSYELLPNAEQLLLRGGINYHLKNTPAFATAGYGNIQNYAFDKELRPGAQVSEHRLWQQFLMKNTIGRVAFEHRYRLEQRWLRGEQKDYLNRARYFVRATVPVNKPTVQEKTFFISFYNEVFIHFNKTPFDRNRLYGALGYQFTPAVNAQLGYLAQTVKTTTRQYLQVALFYNIDLRKESLN